MGHVRREMEILRKNPKEMQEINTVTGMKNAFDRIISGLDTAEERIPEPEDISTEIFQIENWKANKKD